MSSAQARSVNPKVELSCTPGAPARVFRRIQSTMKLKRVGDGGHPCLTPVLTANNADSPPPALTLDFIER